jgi:hypothetical protein
VRTAMMLNPVLHSKVEKPFQSKQVEAFTRRKTTDGTKVDRLLYAWQ